MTKELANKIVSLQKHFSELSNLFELNLLATKSDSSDELLKAVSGLICSEFEIKDCKFLQTKVNRYYLNLQILYKIGQHLQSRPGLQGFRGIYRIGRDFSL